MSEGLSEYERQALRNENAAIKAQIRELTERLDDRADADQNNNSAIEAEIRRLRARLDDRV